VTATTVGPYAHGVPAVGTRSPALSVEDVCAIARARLLLHDGTARRIRRAAEWSQGRVGDAIGVTAGSVAHYEHHLSEPSTDVALRLARVLKQMETEVQ